MASQRILGQNASVILVQDGAPLTEVSCIKSFSFTFELEMKDEGYLGETTNRKDSVFKGVKLDLEMHSTSSKTFEVIQAMIDKARRRTPGTVINIKASLVWPNGDVVRVTFPDVAFGDFPVNVGSRTDYITFKMDGACSEARIVRT